MRLLICSGVLGLALSLGACGGHAEGGESSCGKVPPCGGDPVGTWQVSDTCVDSKSVGEELINGLASTTGCTTAKLESTHVRQRGSATFNADMTFSTQLTSSFDATVSVPSSCLKVGGFPITCDQLNALFTQVMTTGIESFVCSKASDGCSCKIVGESADISEGGSYAVSGSHLDLTGTSDGGAEYCVKDGQLHLIELAPGSQTIASDIVLRRQ